MDRYTIMMGTCESQGKVEKIFTISPDLFFEERDKLKAEIKNPNATDESIGKIATDIVNAKVSQKLGEYEDIDESPEHLNKINKVFGILKSIFELTSIPILLKTLYDEHKITAEDGLLLEEMLIRG